MSKVLKEMPYAQAIVITNPITHTISLVSYQTTVAVIDPEGWLTIYGLYSATTRKHLKAFCKEYCGFDNFATIKLLANEKLRMNIHTGEVISM